MGAALSTKPWQRMLRRSQKGENHLSLQEEMRFTLASVRLLTEHCTSARSLFSDHDYLIHSEIEHLSSLDNALRLPVRTEGMVVLKPKDYLIRDYRELSIFLEYIQHSKKQHTAFKERVLKRGFREVERSLRGLLTRLESLMRRHGGSDDMPVVERVMPEYLKKLKYCKGRYFRDYVIVTDAIRFINVLEMNYETLYRALLVDMQ